MKFVRDVDRVPLIVVQKVCDVTGAIFDVKKKQIVFAEVGSEMDV